MNPRVCIVRHRDYELPVKREAEALRDAGYRVDVICIREPGHGLVEDDDGIRLYRLPLSRERGGPLRYVVDYALFFVVTAVALGFLHLRDRYDVIQINTMPDFLAYTAVVPRLLGAKVLVFMKEPSPELAEMTFGPGLMPRIFTWIEQAVLRYADLSLTVTQQLKDLYVARGADASKIEVVLNGPDPRFFLRLGQATENGGHDPFTVVCHGTIEDRYGHATLLEAIDLVRREVPDVRLVITGSGNGEDVLVAQIEELDLADHVSFHGHVPMSELVEILCSADLGVVAMRSNRYSNLVHTNKMFDYILLAKPVVATRLDAVAGYFDERSVAFVEPDDPKAMAEAIVELYRDPSKREELASNALKLYQEYGWDRQREIYLAAYDRLLQRRSGEPR